MLSIPVIVSSFYGMNVDLPFMGFAHAFSIVLAIAFVISLGFGLVFWRKKYF
jgi:magnesium transporter